MPSISVFKEKLYEGRNELTRSQYRPDGEIERAFCLLESRTYFYYLGQTSNRLQIHALINNVFINLDHIFSVDEGVWCSLSEHSKPVVKLILVIFKCTQQHREILNLEFGGI